MRLPSRFIQAVVPCLCVTFALCTDQRSKSLPNLQTADQSNISSGSSRLESQDQIADRGQVADEDGSISSRDDSEGGIEQGESSMRSALSLPVTEAERQNLDVTSYLDSHPNKAELLASAKFLSSLKLGRSNEIKVQSCGEGSAAKVYSPAESIRVFELPKAPEVGDLPLLKREFAHFVTKHHSTVQSIRKEAERRNYKRLGLSVLTWNAFFLTPTPFDLLAPFLADDGNHINVNNLDMVIIHLQENNIYNVEERNKLLRGMKFILNTLSETKNWHRGEMHFLNNLIGTKLKAAIRPNSQALIFVVRTSISLTNVCIAKNAVKGREKGSLAVSFGIKDFGTLALMGVHLPGWDRSFLSDLFDSFIQKCGMRAKGLDSFNLGLLVSGDWNEHVDNKAMKALEPRILEHPADYPAMQRLEKSTPLSRPFQRMADRLTLALSEPLLEIKQRYHAILWATDRLGRSGTVGGGPNTLPSVLRKRGFSLISACYPAGWTYKWTPAYRHAPDIGPLDGRTPFAYLRDYLAPKVYESKRGVGYLDRTALRLHSICQAIVDRITESNIPVGPTTKLPPTFGTIIHSGHTFNLQSDHLMVYNVLEFLRAEHEH